MTNWVTVYSDSFAPGVEMIKSLLEENQIPCIVINRQCSSYTGVGFASVEVNLQVPEDFVKQASALLNS